MGVSWKENGKIWLMIILFLLLCAMAFALLYKAPARPTANSSTLEKVVTEDGNVTRTDYVNAEGRLTYATNLQYASVVKTRDGDTVVEEYFDENGERTVQPSGHYALRREYSDGKEVRTVWLDENLQPAINTSGYAIRERQYSDEGKVATEKYLGIDSQPIATTSGVYGRKNEYVDGLNTTIIYTDAEGNPLNNSSG